MGLLGDSVNVAPDPLKLPVSVPALLLLGLVAYVVLQVPESELPVCARVNTTTPLGWPAGTVFVIAPLQFPAIDCVEGDVGADEPPQDAAKTASNDATTA